MSLTTSETALKRQLGLTITSLIALWEKFEEEGVSFETVTNAQKHLKEANKTLKKYKEALPL
jgi:hypothetical protein